MARKKANENSSCASFLGLMLFVFISLLTNYSAKHENPEGAPIRKNTRPLSLTEKLKRYSDQDLIIKLDEPGFRATKESGSGRNLLHIACDINRPAFARKLIETGFPVNQPDRKSYTPIMIALLSDSRKCVELLMENKPDLTIDCRHRYPIHSAAEKGYIDVVKESLRQGVGIESVTLSSHFTPLHLAAHSGRFDIVVLLIENGANPSATISYGWTPGDLAFNKYKHISLYLQNKGGYLNVGQLSQEFMLVDGWPLPRPDEIEKTLDSSEKELFAAVSNNDLALLEKAESSRDFDAKSKAGTPLLCFALLNKKPAAAEIILSRVKKLDQTDMASRTALICAVLGEDEEIAARILKKGANPNFQDLTGNTALHYAVKTWQNKLVPQLINAGAEVFAQNLLQQGPLHIAIESNNLQILEFLIQNGCDINLDDARGNTALHLAAMQSNLPMVQRLLKNGANPYITNLAGKTPLEVTPAEDADIKNLLKNRSEIEGVNPAQRAPAEINLQLPKVETPEAEKAP